MNVNTGEVQMMTQEAAKKLGEEWEEVHECQMTDKQACRHHHHQQPVVSPHDNKSELGKLRVDKAKKLKNRQKRKSAKSARRRNKK
jgi:hypothetical protein